MNNVFVDRGSLEEIIYDVIGELSLDAQLMKLERSGKADGVLFLFNQTGTFVDDVDAVKMLDLHLIRFQAKKIEGHWMFREITK